MTKRPRATVYGMLALGLLAFAGEFTRTAAAQEPPQAPAGNVDPPAAALSTTADAGAVLLIVCSALTLLMTPALGLFYGGMVRRKNVLAAFLQSFVLLGVISLQWVIAGYSLAFGPDIGAGLCGGAAWLGLWDVGLEPSAIVAPRVPHQLFMVFQLAVAILAAALISGAIAERMKFSAYLLFMVAWTTLVYDPVAHWVWGPGGWIGRAGALDFGGGLVVHFCSGLAGLCGALVLGKRKGVDTEDLQPHNLTLTALSTGLLWFGWLGLNTGGSRGATAAGAAAFVSTQLAGAAGIVTWSALEYLQQRKVTVLGACTGAIAGLVAVSPAAGFVTPAGAIALAALAAPLCYGAISLKGKLGYDDSLDVFGVHGIGGFFGAIALSLLARSELTGKAGGLLEGTTDLLFSQTIAVAAIAVYTVAATLVLLVVIDRTIGLRVSAEHEDVGLDLAEHGQRGYIMGEGELIGIGPR